ncbi:MAG: cysteine synthase A [Ruminococcaceae bacterium]|nr:cysteine synthase A [Oscillospiraceae bacterium]
MLVHSVAELIGKTPLLQAENLMASQSLCARLLLKLECFNPAGSVKDRVAFQMLADAEQDGRLQAGGTVVEPTSGNTGIGLAALCAAKGYRLIITMPDTMSVERQKLMTAYGAQLVLTDGKRGMTGAIEKAEEIAASIDGAIVAGQFVNPSNPKAHERTTGPEIWADTDGKVDIFVAGVGTGGTVTGTGRFLKAQKPSVRVVAVEPADSPVLSGGKAGAHGLQGIGAGFVPEVLDTAVYDEVVRVTTEEAYAASRLLAAAEGVLCGISSGAALHAAMKIAADPANAGKTIVCLLPDTGERYLSTTLF